MSEVLGLPVEFAGCAQVEEPAGFCRFRFAGKSRVGGGAGGGGGLEFAGSRNVFHPHRRHDVVGIAMAEAVVVNDTFQAAVIVLHAEWLLRDDFGLDNQGAAPMAASVQSPHRVSHSESGGKGAEAGWSEGETGATKTGRGKRAVAGVCVAAGEESESVVIVHLLLLGGGRFPSRNFVKVHLTAFESIPGRGRVKGSQGAMREKGEG